LVILVHLGQQFLNPDDSTAEGREFLLPRPACESKGDTLAHVIHTVLCVQFRDIPQLFTHKTNRLVGQLKSRAQASN
jgi:hypothetical protein